MYVPFLTVHVGRRITQFDTFYADFFFVLFTLQMLFPKK